MSLSTQYAGKLPLCVLLIQPRLQRRKVVDYRSCVHLIFACKCPECIRPGLTQSHRQHLFQLFSRRLVTVNRALVKRTIEPCFATQRAMKLELENGSEK